MLQVVDPALEPKQLLKALRAFKSGDFSVRLPLDLPGIDGEIAATFNKVIHFNDQLVKELRRIRIAAGRDGKIHQRGKLVASGSWQACMDLVNDLIGDMAQPTVEVARVIGAVAKGDLSQVMALDIEGRPLRGEFLRIGKVVNTMVGQLRSFSSEVTRVAREVGTEGKLGGQAQVKGVAGTWKDLTDNVNMMAANLTSQVRNIAEVTTAVASGDLSKKITVDVKGEILELKNTINVMVDQLNSFASEVTRVAREVGTEGKLGGQARVPGAAGLWRDLTDNVNMMAANLTNQVRAIAEVATAVTKGDLTQSISVEASGKVAALKDNINEMVRNLADTTHKNTEQNWLITNLAKFARMLQGQRDLVTVTNLILSEMVPLVNASYGVFYLTRVENGEEFLELASSYAFKREQLTTRFAMREGLIGQCAHEKRRILLTNVPGDYIQISSGLGAAPPLNLLVLPVLFERDIKGVLELASFESFSETHQTFLNQLTESIGIVLNTIAAIMRTEGLLAQSQLLTKELQSQQEELKKTNDRLEQQAKSLQKSEELLKAQQEELRGKNEELEEKARLLENQKQQVEIKNQEIERAKGALEEKAEQLALTSKYKSEFLANMSHELRTPLNSLLILSKLLSDNIDQNLTEKQVQFAETIRMAGTELLGLINDILDLSKIESGTVTLDMGDVTLGDLKDYVTRTFEQIARNNNLDFVIYLDESLPSVMYTDSKRLHQVIKNLLSNSFKFTEKGEVRLEITRATHGWSSRNRVVNAAPMVVAFSVTDTGIGIPADKQKTIFEAFQQADGTTSRKYGGTGLGLSISREIARLLGGEITVVSAPGQGSTFTLYVPLVDDGVAAASRPYMGGSAATTPAEPEEEEMPVLPAVRSGIKDDRDDIQPGDRVLAIVEDDPKFASILLDLAHEHGFKGLVATNGRDALALARRSKPDAITLDIKLPDMDGWRVLDSLKRDPETRHIPVNVMSAADPRHLGTRLGAFSVLPKPMDREVLRGVLVDTEKFLARKVKQLLVVEDDEVQRGHIVRTIGNSDVESTCVSSGAEALAEINAKTYDCVILDLGLGDMDGAQVLREIRHNTEERLPVIIYTARDLTKEEQAELSKLADSVIHKDSDAIGRLFDDCALFLHRVVAGLPEDKQELLAGIRQQEPMLEGRKILIVDDDVRNVFSLASALEQHKMDIVHADNARDGISILEQTPDIDLVLMDIMMPEMDGYETMRAIRARNRFKQLPIIAITAKAMTGDREKCMEAGASDYLAKPVDIDQIVSMMRIWLQKSTAA